MSKKYRNIIFMVLFLMLSNLLIGSLFLYDSKSLNNSRMESGSVKEINGSIVSEPVMLSSGPRQPLGEASYLVIVKYKTDSDDNLCEIYSDETGVIHDKVFSANHRFLVSIVKSPGAHLEILSYFCGQGSLRIDTVGIIPLWIFVINIVSVFLLVIILGCRKLMNIEISDLVVILPLWAGFLGNVYYIDGSGRVSEIKLILALGVLLGLLLLIACFADKINKEVVWAGLTLAACWFLEWENIRHYNFSFRTLFFTECITFCFVLLIYLVCEHSLKRYCVLLIFLTTLFGIYSMIQYMYYSYFKDFFTIKIVGLFLTAMEASSSISELLTQEALSYVGILLLYYFGFVYSSRIMKKLFHEG